MIRYLRESDRSPDPDMAAGRSQRHLNTRIDLALQVINVRDDANHPPFLLQVDKRLHRHIERFGIKTAETLVNEEGIKLNATGVGLHDVR